MDGNWRTRRPRKERRCGDDDEDEGGAGRAAAGQHGDEATKSIILLNNKPCYVRFAKITKTTTRSRFCVYAGSFIRALSPRPPPPFPFILPQREIIIETNNQQQSGFSGRSGPDRASAGVTVIIVTRIMLRIYAVLREIN